jgi:hypothetical protein
VSLDSTGEENSDELSHDEKLARLRWISKRLEAIRAYERRQDGDIDKVIEWVTRTLYVKFDLKSPGRRVRCDCPRCRQASARMEW